ncbi:MAG: hypothetical protein FWH02_05780 [Oscillospiraceae bacterium]|nr:hypothetical protein [Oscillospiraceae bacterium]
MRGIFALYSSLEPEGAAKWDVLCRKAADYVESRIRSGLAPGENSDRLAGAAALWAYADYLSLGSTITNANEIKVGDITVKQNESSGGGYSPAKLRELALEDIGDLIEPGGFVFQSIGEDAQ